MLGQREYGKAHWHVLLEPVGQLRLGIAAADNPLGPNALAALRIRCVVDSVPGEMELAGLTVFLNIAPWQ